MSPKAIQQQIITGRVLQSILLGATEQVNCSNCSSGFGSIGSYALGAHGRRSLTDELTVMGGFSYDEYSASGITVTNAPTFAGSLVYDPVNFGRSRPFVEIGGGVVPFEQVKYSRSYQNGLTPSVGEGQGLDRSLGLFGRVGWVDRFSPIDEAAVYTDISRSWLSAGGYTETSTAVNPFPATVKSGIDSLNVARLGGQYTHLLNGQFEVNVSAAVAYGFGAGIGSQWDVYGYGPVAPYPIANSAWCEWGARIGYRLANRMVVDAFALGTVGGERRNDLPRRRRSAIPVLRLSEPERPLFLVERNHRRPALGQLLLGERGETLLIVIVQPDDLDGGDLRGVGRHLPRGEEISRPVGLQNVVVQRLKMLELAALRGGLVARQGEERNRSRLVLQLDVIDLEPGELRRLVPGGGACDDVDAELLGRPLEARSDVDLVAERRIVEPLGGPHVADAAFAGVEADAELDRIEGTSRLLGLLLPSDVQADQGLCASRARRALRGFHGPDRRAAHSRRP